MLPTVTSIFSNSTIFRHKTMVAPLEQGPGCGPSTRIVAGASCRSWDRRHNSFFAPLKIDLDKASSRGFHMAEVMKLVASQRVTRGSQAAKKLRRSDKIPGIVYGHKQDPVMISVLSDDLASVVRLGSRVVDLELNGNSEKCLVREIQWDVFGRDMIHVDLARVSADERIHVTVSVTLRGTPAGLAQGGVLVQPVHSLEIECPALSVPDSLRVNVAELQLGQAVHVRELVLPEGVTIRGDKDLVLVQVSLPQQEAPTSEVAEGPAEPERIGRKAEDKEEEAE
jgi:large subunit ribosomal protein L25